MNSQIPLFTQDPEPEPEKAAEKRGSTPRIRRARPGAIPQACRKCVYWPDGGNGQSHGEYFCWGWIRRDQGPIQDEPCQRRRTRPFKARPENENEAD